MMKKKHSQSVAAESVAPAKLHPKQALMDRLANGSKWDMSKADMKKLTNKNYENLPEVRKKREEEQKKEERKRQLQIAKELEKQRRDQLKTKGK
jgi:hypothetical protein